MRNKTRGELLDDLYQIEESIKDCEADIKFFNEQNNPDFEDQKKTTIEDLELLRERRKAILTQLN